MKNFSFIIIYLLSFLLFQCERQSTPISNVSEILSVSGGGFYGGINPTTINKTTIYSDGKVNIIHGSLYGDTTETIIFVEVTEISFLKEVVVNNGFFEMNNIYDCSQVDSICQNRKLKYPSPIPLIMTAKINGKFKKVEVTIFNKEFVDYPEGLDKILSEVSRIINMGKD